MTTDVQDYRNELLFALRMRDVPGPRIAEALAEVDSHVTETGEDPREAFGPPTAYADELTAALGGPPSPRLWRSVLSWSTATYAVGGAVGTWLLLDGVLAFVADERALLGMPPAASLLLGLAVLLATVVRFVRLARQKDTEVLDPRTGADITPPTPAWGAPRRAGPAGAHPRPGRRRRGRATLTLPAAGRRLPSTQGGPGQPSDVTVNGLRPVGAALRGILVRGRHPGTPVGSA